VKEIYEWLGRIGLLCYVVIVNLKCMKDVQSFITVLLLLTYYMNVISERELTFTFAICHRPSVCLSSVVCNIRAPYEGD